jgi:hypothetical protein
MLSYGAVPAATVEIAVDAAVSCVIFAVESERR